MNKKYKVLDLFCGCGGISEGFHLAGFEIVGGIDFNEGQLLNMQLKSVPLLVSSCDTLVNSTQLENIYLKLVPLLVSSGGIDVNL